MEALLKAIEVAGGVSRLAEMVDVSSSAPSMWKARGRIPVEHCTAIERATGGVVTRRDLRPDDWQDIWPELADTTPTGQAGAEQGGRP